MLENIVYFKLIRRGYEVTIGKNGLILTMDQPVFGDYSGIRIQNILDFLFE